MEPIITIDTLFEGIDQLGNFFDSNIQLITELENQLERIDSIHPELLTDREIDKLNDMREVISTNIFLLKKVNEDPHGLYGDLIEKTDLYMALGN